jgi:hypothetical protein
MLRHKNIKENACSILIGIPFVSSFIKFGVVRYLEELWMEFFPMCTEMYLEML